MRAPVIPYKAFVFLWLSFLSLSVRAEPPPLQSDTSLATGGYFVLSWQAPEGGSFELRERRTDVPARVLYRGPDTARLISGKPDGEYLYQVRRIDEPEWSEPLRVRVEHHSLARALTFFVVGAVVFVATLIVVARGAEKD